MSSEAFVELRFLVAGMRLDLFERRDLILQLDLTRKSAFSQILSAFLQGEAGLVGELLDLGLEHLLLAGGLQAPRHGPFELALDLVDGAVGLADRLAHHRLATGLLHPIDRVFHLCGEEAGNARKNRLSHEPLPIQYQEDKHRRA